ncbi:MAG: hypothetical protein KDA24_05605 [Deltaproteobacteria bacterium]|nr:hypothetical protein [Deltaproteobacteria bacterium]
MSLFDLLAAKPIDVDAVAAHLDGLDTAGRIAEIQTIPGRLQGALWAAATGKAVPVDHFVPAEVPDGTFIRHYGRNSFPIAAFADFEKRFARPRKGAKELWAYNHSPVMGLIGAGHFVLRNDKEHKTTVCDYYRVPPVQLEGAPEVRSNSWGLSFFVYRHMLDVMWQVSKHVTVGRVVRNGYVEQEYFLLVRQEVVA